MEGLGRGRVSWEAVAAAFNAVFAVGGRAARGRESLRKVWGRVGGRVKGEGEG